MTPQHKDTNSPSRSPISATAKTTVVLGVLMALSRASMAGANSQSIILNAPPSPSVGLVESVPDCASGLSPSPPRITEPHPVELEHLILPNTYVGTPILACSASNANAKGDQSPSRLPASNSGPRAHQRWNKVVYEAGTKRRVPETVSGATIPPHANIELAGNGTNVTEATIQKVYGGNALHVRRPHQTGRRFYRNPGRYRRLRSRQIPRKSYNLIESHEGSTFFDGWDFFDQSDPTHGMITYVSAGEARSSGLAYVLSDGVAVMTVDTNSTLSSGSYRKSVRITTKRSYNKGLFVFDILRAPHGCAVWPAAWIVGPNWPNSGEIDVIEGVHNSGYNQATIHSAPGCMLDTSKALAGGLLLAAGVDATNVFTGIPLDANCDVNMSYNAGCGILDTDARSYGMGLNSSGGAVYATLWDDTGVRIWFFSRDAVPVDVSAKNPDPSTWGSPMAFWAASSCAPSFFSDMSIVFDIVLGGDWAGATFSEAGCPGSLADFVSNPANFANANWAVNSVRIYQ